jgi:hypothetical protein|tara:strand:- start:73 stop:342 length:270 start_codon:yes stop_codon:yes gene_type:complete
LIKDREFLALDGFRRDKSEDTKINLNIATLFNTDAGRSVLKYLRSITIEQVNGAGVSDAELRHMEGQRYIVGLIETRMQHAHKNKEVKT